MPSPRKSDSPFRYFNSSPEEPAFLVDGAPQVDHLAVQLHVHLVEMPAPLFETAHRTHPLAADVASEQQTEPVPPHPHRLVADVDPAFEQQVLDVPEAQGVLRVHHHHQADHFGRGVEVAERAGGFAGARHDPAR